MLCQCDQFSWVERGHDFPSQVTTQRASTKLMMSATLGHKFE